LAGGVAVVLSAFVWVAGEYGMVRLQQHEIAWALAILWVVNLIILGVLRSGLNLRFKDPSLTMVQIIWAIFCVIYITYYLNEARAGALMIGLLVMNFGAFRLTLTQLISVAVYAIAGYMLVVYLFYVYHPEAFGLQVELFVLSGFAAALLGTTLVGHEMYVLRETLRDRNRELETALEKVNLLAVTDELTNAHNRRYIDDVLERQVALAHRGHYRFSICFFDLDHFKNINDTYGHAAGDKILVEVVKIATAAIRTGDYLARYGGEEFIIIFSATAADRAATVSERIRRTIADTEFDALGPDTGATSSFGVTEYRAPETVKDLLARADEAMYAAKESGRNTVVRA